MKIYSHGIEIFYVGSEGQYLNVALQCGAVQWIFGFGFVFLSLLFRSTIECSDTREMAGILGGFSAFKCLTIWDNILILSSVLVSLFGVTLYLYQHSAILFFNQRMDQTYV